MNFRQQQFRQSIQQQHMLNVAKNKSTIVKTPQPKVTEPTPTPEPTPEPKVEQPKVEVKPEPVIAKPVVEQPKSEEKSKSVRLPKI